MDFKAMLAAIAAMNTQQLEEQRSAINGEIDGADEARLGELEQLLQAVEERSKALALEQRRADMARVAGGAGSVLGAGAAHEPEVRSLERVLGSTEYEEAFAEYLKSGNATECRALLTDLVTGGTVPIPTYVADRVEVAWEHSVIASRLRRVVSDGQMEFPFEVSATGAVVHKEGTAAPAEEELVLGKVLVTPETIKKWITISDTAMRLKGRAFLDYIYDEIENRIMLKADSEFLDAVKASPATSSETAVGVPVLTPAAIDASTIFSALALLSSDATRPVAIMHKQTFFNVFMALTDTTKRPIYNVVVENGRPVYYLNGVEVIFSSELTPLTEIIVGDLEGGVMLVPDDAQVTFVTDPYSLAEKNMVKIVGKLLVGFGVTRPNYFVRITVTPTAGS